jgi:hypothetical protein
LTPVLASAGTADIIINGNLNLLNLTQTGAQVANINLQGNDHNVGITQSGAGNHSATVNLQNQGGGWDFNLNQSGAARQTYEFNGVCHNVARCGATVVQP